MSESLYLMEWREYAEGKIALEERSIASSERMCIKPMWDSSNIRINLAIAKSKTTIQHLKRALENGKHPSTVMVPESVYFNIVHA